MSRRILTVFGTRPEAIKLAPVVLRLAGDDRFDSRVCVTAQHRELLDPVLDLFGIEPDHDLDLMSPGQDLHDLAARVLCGVRDVLRAEEPELVLVHGDTTTCLAAALASTYGGIPVAHVEAGLRTGDRARPFPEELNRALLAQLATKHFAPTPSARDNLLREGISAAVIHVTGNTVIDALSSVRQRLAASGAGCLAGGLGSDLAARLETHPGPVILTTAHRRESFGRGLEGLCTALRLLSAAHPEWLFVYPVHPNPSVRGPVHQQLEGLENIALTEPLDYLPFVRLMGRSDLILTDSGGVQEEAPSLGKPVLVTRELTERPEAVEAGTVELVGTNPSRIVSSVESLMTDRVHYERMARARNPYGDGRAAERIVELLAEGGAVVEAFAA